jgi:hypothetical protein
MAGDVTIECRVDRDEWHCAGEQAKPGADRSPELERLLEELECEPRDQCAASSTPVTLRGAFQRAPMAAPITSALEAANPYRTAVSMRTSGDPLACATERGSGLPPERRRARGRGI